MQERSMFDYKGKKVVVIGGTSGINLGIACAFAAQGADVAVASRSIDKVNAAVDALKQVNGNGHHVGVSFDVRDPEAVTKGFAEIEAQFDYIDVLVSGAAGNFPARAKDLSVNGFKSVMDIDLLGSFQVIKQAYPLLVKGIKQNGPNSSASVIQISAPQAYVPMALQVHVCAAKAGVDMLTRTLAIEWGVDKIRVNSIVPGPIADTEGFDRLAPSKGLKSMIADSVPLKRNGQKQDIANAALFLASDMASYITGTILPVDGGWSLGGAGAAMDALAKHLPEQ
ncbi:SDR family oxidoreductase [Shewanella sp. TC10]|uniref:SDR family oxidoreductase n=1 Tax=Shewanella sp. TC10 TaxID=1419739 RepID=UPI00129E8100|nr:SDR family oxidoreductase [Shewanella sp. TC10]